MENRFTIVNARNEFQTFAYNKIERLQKQYQQLSDRILLYKKIQPHLVHLLEEKRMKLEESLIDLTTVWELSEYNQIRDETFENWVKQKYPVVYQQNFEPQTTDEVFSYTPKNYRTCPWYNYSEKQVS